MTDRVKLLRAIRTFSDDDTPRLVFADWLDEHAETDRDTATAEFIRVGCLGRNARSGRMPTRTYDWLGQNWQRLVPTLLAQHHVLYVRDGPLGAVDHAPIRFKRNGRTVHVAIKRPASQGSGLLLWFPLVLEFDRGFMKNVVLGSATQAGQLLDALAADQPFSCLHVLDGGTTVRMDLWSRSFDLQKAPASVGGEHDRCD